MTVFPPRIDYSILIEGSRRAEISSIFGKVCDSESFLPHIHKDTSFLISEGVVTLQLARGMVGFDFPSKFEFPVGHVLSTVLRAGDRLEIRRGGDGCWTYWLEREGLFVIGSGWLSGTYGSNVRIKWFAYDWTKPSISDQPLDPEMSIRASRVIVRVDDESVEFERKTLGSAADFAKNHKFMAKFLGYGSDGMPGSPPRIALLVTERSEARAAFESLFPLLPLREDDYELRYYSLRRSWE